MFVIRTSNFDARKFKAVGLPPLGRGLAAVGEGGVELGPFEGADVGFHLHFVALENADDLTVGVGEHRVLALLRVPLRPDLTVCPEQPQITKMHLSHNVRNTNI